MTLHNTLPARLSGNRWLNVRFAPISDRDADIPVRHLCADFVAEVGEEKL
jgi:hypothetical protein